MIVFNFHLTDEQLDEAAWHALATDVLRGVFSGDPDAPAGHVMAVVRALTVLDRPDAADEDEDEDSVVVEGQAAS